MFLANKLNKGGSLGGYQISRSLRFDSASSAYLSRTFTTPTNNTSWSFSFWSKRSTLSTQQFFLNTNLYCGVGINNDAIVFWSNVGISVATSTPVFRDASAWYHFVFVSNGTTIKAYVNNSEVLSYTGTITNLNSGVVHNIGRDQTSNSAFLDGYMTEINFIDGQALTPSSFGETNAQTGVWQPKAYSGSYGTNGFYLNFSDNSNTTAATLGKDYSGNGNNWTPNGFLVSAGVNNDSLVDSPTSYGTDTGVGGTVRGNYSTLNALSTGFTLSNGNLNATNAATGNKSSYSTIGVSSGKWYAEAVWTTTGSTAILGVALQGYANTDGFAGGTLYSYGYEYTGQKYNNGSGVSYAATWTNGDVISVALDLDAGTITYYKNGTSQGTAFTGLPAGTYFIGVSLQSATCDINFGQRPFAYTAPSGFKALCTQNLPTPTIGATTATLASQFFAPVLYTGNGATQTVTVGFQPDLVWAKSRSNAYWHTLVDSVRGRAYILSSNVTNAETGPEPSDKELTAFTSSGFSLGPDYNLSINSSGATFVAWNWRASNATAVTNTAGSITSTVSANTTSGFSVVTYTGTGATATVGHGLGVEPSMIICKARGASSTDWAVYTQTLGINYLLQLNLTNAAISITNKWSGTNSSVFGVNSATNVNGSSVTYVAYCFAEVAGYSKFGSYTGNGSTDGPFVYTGFRPAYLLVKQTNGTNYWFVFDSARDTSNVVDLLLDPNDSRAEISGALFFDFLSNGFKSRATDAGQNASGGTYIYMAFAQNPFKYSLAR